MKHLADHTMRRAMIVRMSAKGLFTIPSAIRHKFGMKKRARIHMDIDEQNHKIVLTPISPEHIRRLRGKYKGKGLLKALTREKRVMAGNKQR